MEQFDRINSRAREMFLIYPKKKKKNREMFLVMSDLFIISEITWI